MDISKVRRESPSVKSNAQLFVGFDFGFVFRFIFGPRALVAHLSRQLTLLPGDVIACGTSVGIGVLRAGLSVAPGRAGSR